MSKNTNRKNELARLNRAVKKELASKGYVKSHVEGKIGTQITHYVKGDEKATVQHGEITYITAPKAEKPARKKGFQKSKVNVTEVSVKAEKAPRIDLSKPLVMGRRLHRVLSAVGASAEFNKKTQLWTLIDKSGLDHPLTVEQLMTLPGQNVLAMVA